MHDELERDEFALLGDEDELEGATDVEESELDEDEEEDEDLPEIPDEEKDS